VAGLPENKVTTNLRYARGPWSLFLQERYIGGGLDDRRLVESTTRIPGRTTIDDNTVGSVLYTDLTFNFAGGEGGNTPWETFLTINNLTNEEPAATYGVVGRAGVPGPNTFLYDTIGRRFVAGVRVNF
jgi:outer membrane receptor protein involved in Fe transport